MCECPASKMYVVTPNNETFGCLYQTAIPARTAVNRHRHTTPALVFHPWNILMV